MSFKDIGCYKYDRQNNYPPLGYVNGNIDRENCANFVRPRYSTYYGIRSNTDPNTNQIYNSCFAPLSNSNLNLFEKVDVSDSDCKDDKIKLYKSEPFIYKGTFVDNTNEDLSALPYHHSGNYNVDSCQNKALQYKHNVFGLKQNGQCYSGRDYNMATAYGKMNVSNFNLANPTAQNIYYTEPSNINRYITPYDYQGCYNITDNSNNKNVMKFIKKVNNIDECEKAAKKYRKKAFSVNNNGDCYLSDNVDDFKVNGITNSNKYDRTKCGKLGSNNAQYVYSTNDTSTQQYDLTSQELKCYKDNYPDLSGLDTDEKLQNHWYDIGLFQERNSECPSYQTSSGDYLYQGCFNYQPDTFPFAPVKVNSVDECQTIATNNKHQVFGINNGGYCRTGNDLDNATKYEQQFKGMMCSDLGGETTQQIYYRNSLYSDIASYATNQQLSNANFSNV